MQKLVVYHAGKAAFSHKDMRNSPKRLNHKRKDFDSQSPEKSYMKRFPGIGNSNVGVLRCSPPHHSWLPQRPPLLPPSSNPSQPSAVLSSARLSTVMRNFRKSEQEPPKRKPDGNMESESYPFQPDHLDDPGDLPKKVFGVFSSAEFAEKWTGSVFYLPLLQAACLCRVSH